MTVSCDLRKLETLR